MREVGKDLEVGPISLSRLLHLARREDPVLTPADDQHGELGYGCRPGQREGHHVEVGEVRLVLQPLVVGPDLRLAHGAAEEHLPSKLGGIDDRPQAHRQVGLEKPERMAVEEAERGLQHAGRRHRGDQHGGGGGVALEVLLHDQAAHRVADHNRRLGHRRGGFGDVGDILGDPGPAQPLAPRGAAVAAQVDRLHRPAAIAEVAEEMLLPAPSTVPGTMYEQKRRHSGPSYPRSDTNPATTGYEEIRTKQLRASRRPHPALPISWGGFEEGRNEQPPPSTRNLHPPPFHGEGRVGMIGKAISVRRSRPGSRPPPGSPAAAGPAARRRPSAPRSGRPGGPSRPAPGVPRGAPRRPAGSDRT